MPAVSNHMQNTTTTTFITMYHQAFPLLLENAENMGVDRQNAEDIIQECLLQAWQEGNAVVEEQDVLARWGDVVEAQCQRFLEKEALLCTTGVLEENFVIWPIFEQAVVMDQSPTAVDTALQRPPIRYRRVLELRYIEGLTFRQTCAVLHVSRKALKQRAEKAAQNLRREMHKAAAVEAWFKTALQR